MANATSLRQHPNAPLTPAGRRRKVDWVLVQGWTVEAAADRFQVDAKTVRKWRDRWLAEGDDGLWDRSSRPHRSPNRTPRRLRRRVLVLRQRRRWGADHIGFEVGLAASTVQGILNRAGVGRLDRGDRATNRQPVARYQRDTPGELIHVDIKKIAGIPDGGGWRLHGRGNDAHHGHSGAGYRYIHTAIDDRTRIAYSEILDNEQAATAAGFWQRAAAWYQTIGIEPQRVITDNGSCYRSGLWHRACAATDTTVKKTRPYRPQTNGKVERFHRILVEEWAYIRPWDSETERTQAYVGFIHFHNHHRAHGALGWATPISITRDNLPEEHNYSTWYWSAKTLLPTTPRGTRIAFSPAGVRQTRWVLGLGQNNLPCGDGEGGGAGDSCECVPGEARARVDPFWFERVQTHSSRRDIAHQMRPVGA